MANEENTWPDYEADPVGHCSAALREGDVSQRCSAADILRGLGEDGEPAIELLIETMRSDTDAKVRAECAFAVSELVSRSQGRLAFVVPALLAALEDNADAEVRAASAQTLAELGEATRQAVPTLRRALEDRHQWVREAARDALVELDRERLF